MSAYATMMSEVSKSILFVVNAVRNGTVLNAPNDFAFHLWNIQGYLQGITLGQPTGVDVLAGSINADTANRSQLEDLKVLSEVESIAVFGTHDAKQVNIIQLVSMAKIIFDMLKSLGIFDRNTEKDRSNRPTNLDVPKTDPPVVDKAYEKNLELAKKADATGDAKIIDKLTQQAKDAGYDPDLYETWVSLVEAIHNKDKDEVKK